MLRRILRRTDAYGPWPVLAAVLVATTLLIGAIGVSGHAIEYTSEPHIGDLVHVQLQDGSRYQGELEEATDSRIVLNASGGRVVLLRGSIQRIVVRPRAGQTVRLTMIDGTTYRGAWAGQDATHVYVERSRGEVGLLKSQVEGVELVRSESSPPAFGLDPTAGPLRVAIGLGTWHLLTDALSPSPSLVAGLSSGDAWIGFQLGLRVYAQPDSPSEARAADQRTEMEYQAMGVGTQGLHAIFGRSMVKGSAVSDGGARSVFMIGLGSVRRISGPLHSNAWVAVVLTREPMTVFGFSVALGSL